MRTDHRYLSGRFGRWLNPRCFSAMLMRSLLTIVCCIVLSVSTQAAAVPLEADIFNVADESDPSSIDVYAGAFSLPEGPSLSAAVAPMPEPISVAILGAGAICLIFERKRINYH